MFQPETEDMLPRAAPKPSAPMPMGHVESQVQPIVPELSLLFGQEEPAVNKREQICAQPQSQAPPTSYSAWKKKTLPRVSFPASLATEFGSSTSVNSNMQVSSSSSVNGNGSSTTSSTTSTTATQDYAPSTNTFGNFTRIVSPTESSPTSYNSNSNATIYSDTFDQYRRQFATASRERFCAQMVQQPMLQRRSVDVAQLPIVYEVLTICAGTQTEPVCFSPTNTSKHTVFKDFASKQDLNEVHKLLQQIREDQMRLLQFVSESDFNQKQAQSKMTTPLKEMGTQCELLTSDNVNRVNCNNAPIIHNHIMEEYDQGKHQLPQSDQDMQQAPLPAYNHLKMAQQFQSPRAPPAAQSTAYRANTPQAKRLPLSPANAVVNVLPKPNTEKSMVMNELALKYLPQDKLTELLQELRVSNNDRDNIQEHQHCSPLRPIENYDKSPNDISNASYKYLKKYRLLPGENIVYERQRSSPYRQEQHQSPLSSRQAHSPFQLQQHQMLRPNSPSPLIKNRASPGGLQQLDKNMLDLENIRNQPKLL